MSKTIILASKSPRRIELMRQHGLDPVVSPSQAAEILPETITPESAVMYLAFLKSWDTVSKHMDEYDDMIVIGADTVVVYDNKIIGKPTGPSDAFTTLSMLRNNVHSVITGVSIIEKSGNTVSKECFYETTQVHFTSYSDEELLAYVNTEEPYDKAGGYAIQQTFGKYVDHIEGDYDNVVGFPITRVLEYLNKK